MSAALAAAGTTSKAGNPWSPSTVKLALERLELRGELRPGLALGPLGHGLTEQGLTLLPVTTEKTATTSGMLEAYI